MSTTMTIRLDDDLKQRLDKLADATHRSKSFLATEAIRDFVELEEERRRLTLAALADVEKGQVVDHHAVQAWADSLDTDQPKPVPN